MAWPDPASSTPFTRKPTRPPYIPPHRANDAVFPPPSDPSSFHFSNNNHYAFNRSSPRPRGRGRGGGGYRGGHFNGRQFPRADDHPPRHHRDPPPPQRFPVEVDNNNNNINNNNSNNAAGDVANFDAYESVPVEASGENVPPPVASFAETDLDEDLKRNIERCKYVKPTPVQRHAIPIVAAGRDLMACAQTGSGKTAAFCFPIISGVLKARSGSGFSSIPRSDAFIAYPTALILSPTRELSCQIHAEATKFAHQTGVKIVVAYGGASIVKQLQNLEKGVDILVATPGRLVDIIERERVSLSKIKYLALDEADRMLDMGFEQQIRKIVQQMHMPPPGVRQTMLFSATFPTDIQKLAADFLSNYIFLAVGRVGSSTELILQKIELVQDTDKRNHLANLLGRQRANGDHGKQALTLIFVETKKGADALEIWLSRNGFPAIAIHGDKVQMERERALRSFKRGFTPILVATDVASRGLDIPHVAHVINYDLPRDIADYVHRIGRTGRAGKSGLATAFFSSNKNPPIAKALVEILQEAKQEVPSWLSQFAEGSSSGDRDYGPPRRGRGNFGGRDFRNVTQPAVENYNNYYNSYGNSDHYVEPYVTQPDTVYASNNHYDTSYDYNNTNIPNSVYASSNHHYTDPNAEFCGAGRVENGPWGHASVVATGWD